MRRIRKPRPLRRGASQALVHGTEVLAHIVRKGVETGAHLDRSVLEVREPPVERIGAVRERGHWSRTSVVDAEPRGLGWSRNSSACPDGLRADGESTGKLGRVMRAETMTDHPTRFRHHREVVDRDGTSKHKVAPVKTSIDRLPVLRRLSEPSNRRYLEFLATLDDPMPGLKNLHRMISPARNKVRS